MPENRKKEPRRLGRFSIDMGLVEHQTVMAQLMLSGMVVVGADYRYDQNAIEYMALCDEFDEVPEGHEAPHYVAVFNEQRIDGKDGGE